MGPHKESTSAAKISVHLMVLGNAPLSVAEFNFAEYSFVQEDFLFSLISL